MNMETLNFTGQGFRGEGSVAQKLLSVNMDSSALRPWIGKNGKTYINVNGKAVPIRANATLRKDEWLQYDRAVIEAAQDRLVGVADLESRGLVYNIPNGLGKTVLAYEDASDINDALLSMDGLARGENDVMDYLLKYLPLPITHKNFQINARVLAESRNGNMALDTTLARLAGVKVADYIENMLFNGSSSFAFGGGIIYGYKDHPKRIQGTFEAWTTLGDSGGITGPEIVKTVIDMKQEALDRKAYGPFVLYIPAAYETVLDQDYEPTNRGRTVRQRLLDIGGIQDVKPVDKLAAGNLLLVQMRDETARMVNALPIQTLEWKEEGGLALLYKVMAIKVPQIRANQAGQCGVVHYATA